MLPSVVFGSLLIGSVEHTSVDSAKHRSDEGKVFAGAVVHLVVGKPFLFPKSSFLVVAGAPYAPPASSAGVSAAQPLYEPPPTEPGWNDPPVVSSKKTKVRQFPDTGSRNIDIHFRCGLCESRIAMFFLGLVGKIPLETRTNNRTYCSGLVILLDANSRWTISLGSDAIRWSPKTSCALD